MKHILLSIIFLMVIFPETMAYRRYGLIGRKKNTTVCSIIVSAGPNYCYGDTYGSPYNKSIADGTNWESAVGFRQFFPGNFSYKANLLFGNYTNSDFPNIRNFNSVTSTIELSGRGEYSYFFGGNNRYRTPNHHSVYGFIGLGMMSCNILIPATNGLTSYQLSNTKNKFIAPLIPFGVGYSYAFNDDFAIGTEVGWKYIFSDYLDGYHSDSFSKSNDILGGVAITLTYRISGRKGFLGF